MPEVNESQFSGLLRYPGAFTAGTGTAITQVFEIGPLGLGRELRDVTTLSDTVHKHKLNIPDVPEISVKMYYDPSDTTHNQIIQDGVAGSLLFWGVQLEEGNSPNESLVFQAYVVNPQIDSFGVDQDLVLSFSLKPQSVVWSEPGTAGV
jgi:hypothetical protein